MSITGNQNTGVTIIYMTDSKALILVDDIPNPQAIYVINVYKRTVLFIYLILAKQ